MANHKEKKEPFIIDEEMIKKATSYIPLATKKAIAIALADACLVAVDKGLDGIATETQLPIPQLYREECGAKSLYLMYYFLTEYLHIKLSDEFTEEEYDYYASSHIFNQLERFKSGNNADVKAKVFDILYDYKQLKQMLETEIYNLKESRNDALTRLQDSISLFASPENVKQINDLLQKTIGEVETAQKKLADKRATAKKTETKPAEKSNA